MSRTVSVTILVLLGVCLAAGSWADGEAPTLASLSEQAAGLKVAADTVWVLIAAGLVFCRQAGFAYVVAGLRRAKKATIIRTKNLADLSVGALA